MKWIATGAWKSDGQDAQMVVDAPTQRAAEAIAAGRGMLVEQCIPETQKSGDVHVNVAVAQTAPARGLIPPDPNEAYGLSMGGCWFVVIVGLFLSPMLIGIPLVVWGFVARSAILRARREYDMRMLNEGIKRTKSISYDAPRR